MAVDNK